MAALPLHAPDSSRIKPLPHYRNPSTVSTTTIYTRTSEHSHPTEPLLHGGTSEARAYRDMLSQQPTFVHLPVDGGPAMFPLTEKTNLWDRHVRRRYNRLKLIKGSLVILLGEYVYELWE